MAARFVETTREREQASRPELRHEPMLVLAHHPQLSRAGELLALERHVTEVSRLAPPWTGPDGADAGPLDDPFVSRQPFAIRRLARGGVEITNDHGIALAVAGAAVQQGSIRRLSTDELARGVELVIGDRVVLWLASDLRHERDDLGLSGCSAAIGVLRAEIREAARLAGPVLVVGETGAGKELVARALHAASARRGGPFVAVNMAAIPAAVAASELFGHARGAFTGADEARAGYFERAAGGVVFLDEIGELPEAIQPVLLRALESGEIQPVGGQPRRVDVAVVAATDADLEAEVAARRFRGPLYYRLAATTVRVPPLRERRGDIAVLLARFLMMQLGPEHVDQTTAEHPALPARLVADLLRRPWPGNVRQLQHAASRIAQRMQAGAPVELAELGDGFDEPVPELAGAAIDAARLVATLRAHRFQLNHTAAALGISRTHLDALIARSPQLRKAKDLARDEIAACAEALGGDLDAMAARLEVSPRGLRLRMRQLGL